MNKKAIALAVAGAVTPGFAAAQGFTSVTPTQIAQPAGVASNSGITLYGRLDENLIINKYSQSGTGAISSVKKADLWSAGNAMGFRGREDLGGGTAAWFQLEIGVWPDGRTEAAATTGNNWGGRNSGIGISSGIGDIMFGIWDTPYKVTYGVWNSMTSSGYSAAGITMGNGDSTGALSGFVAGTATACANVVSNTTGVINTVPGGVCVTEATSNGTAFSRRINNSIQYWSPIFGGFQFKLMTAVANYQQPDSGNIAASGQSVKAKEYSANATFARGPFSIGVAVDQHEGLRPGATVNSNANPKDTGAQLGAKLNFGLFEVGAGYELLKYEDNHGGAGGASANGMDVPSWVLNGRVNVGPGAIFASYSKTDAKTCSTPTTVIGGAACGIQAKMMGFGYDYVLSKRTKMYVAYNKIDNGFANGVGSSYYYIAGPATSNGTNGGLAQGTDVTSYGFGLQHLF